MLVRVARIKAVTKLPRYLKATSRSDYLEWGCLYKPLHNYQQGGHGSSWLSQLMASQVL